MRYFPFFFIGLAFCNTSLFAQKLKLNKERMHQLDSISAKQRYLWEDSLRRREERITQFNAKEKDSNKAWLAQHEDFMKKMRLEQAKNDSLSLIKYDSLLSHVNYKDSSRLIIRDVPCKSIPEQVYAYKNLVKLVYAKTEITYIDKGIFELPKLDTLVLSQNELIDSKLPIPKNETITFLDLSNNKLTTTPKKLKNLKELKALKLNDNLLGANGCKVKLHKLKKIEYLNLSNNELTELPKKLYKLKNLTELYLNNNSITSLKGLEKLHNLKELELSGNPVFLDPRYLVGLDSLEKLTLHKCGLIYIPPEIDQLQNLKKLILPENWLTSIPPEIGDLHKLENLMVYKNRLTSVPDEIYGLKNLLWLDIYHNQITEISDKIGQLSKLEILFLSYNKLKVLPDTLGSMLQLKELYAHHNQLRAVPNLSRLKNLEYLHLYNNHITEFPESVAKLTQLKELNLSDNLITEFPYEIRNLTNLKFIYLDHNQTIMYGLPYERFKMALKELNDKGVRIKFDYPRKGN